MRTANPVIWFEIYVDDMARAKTFYQHMLGVELEKLDSPDADMEMWAFPMQENGTGAAGALSKMDGVRPGGGGTLIYFSCEDCAVEARRAAEHGGRIVQDKFAIGPYGHIAIVNDTEGNIIGLHSMQ
ncbi:VOC family protein [Ectothiorhodospiraceae bacterium 2226]|nr:VOC family protein [Ectothiorhodospiraceae bacterium 2226]